MVPLSPENGQVTRPDFETLARLVQAETGLGSGPCGRAALARAVEKRGQALSLAGPAAYRQRLEEDPAEWGRLISHLTDKTTAFFRNPAQFEFLAQGLLPELARLRQERRLTLVSAGCATGEEAYSLAIIARESGLLHKGWRLEVLGLDLNPEALQTARAGLYPAAALAGLSRARIRRWFRLRGERAEVREEIKALVSWARVNLAAGEEGLPPDLWGRADVVLLKNVLLDLTPLAGKRAAQTLIRLLAPGGAALTGPVEGLPFAADRFDLERWGGVIYLRRRADKVKVNVGHTPRKARRAGPARPPAGAGPEPPLPLDPALRALLQTAAAALAQGRPERAWPPLEAALDRQAARGELCPEALGLAARGHLLLERWAEARDLAARVLSFGGERMWAHCLLAEAWAGEGQRSRARAAWEQAAALQEAGADDWYVRLDPVLAAEDPAELIRERLTGL